MIITVGVIAYNEKNSLGSLLKDICKQTYDHKKIEVILVDSNSTDNTKVMTPLRTLQAIEANVEVDTALDGNSDNPVENRVIAAALDGVASTLDLHQSELDSLMAAIPEWDEDEGCYTNESILRWLGALSDGGKVYGVRVPLFDTSPATTGEKVGDNAGLVLEASTETTRGTNDYSSRRLFCCPRVNGGVKASGMPYVTAIEGVREDEHPFDCTEDTYALTWPYYRKVTDSGGYRTKEISEAEFDGATLCPGALLSDGTTRVPYILRACYMDDDGNLHSRSGHMPSANVGSVVAVNHSANSEYTRSTGRSDGLTAYTYADVTWMQDFMEVMLGVKAPKSQAVGCNAYNFQYKVSAAESGVRRVLLTDAQAANILVGSTLSIGTRSANNSDRGQATMHDVAKGLRVTSKEALGDGTTAVYLDASADLTIASTYYVSTMAWYNGTLDGVLGTYGARTTAALTNGREPFRFQNCEFMMGIFETVCNMWSRAVVASGSATHTWYVAPDLSACTGVNDGAGWTALSKTTVGGTGSYRYIKDYADEHGASFPETVGGTNTQGYMSGWRPSDSSGDRETLARGYLNNAAYGVGCVISAYALSRANWNLGGRSSATGHAALAA